MPGQDVEVSISSSSVIRILILKPKVVSVQFSELLNVDRGSLNTRNYRGVDRPYTFGAPGLA